MTTPTLYIIAGCNGAGKTTASFTVLPAMLRCREFVNADEIARGLSPFNPSSVAIQAGKLMLERIDILLSEKATFAIETTLATKSYRQLVGRAKAMGYQVYLLFFWLKSPQVACERVARRVSEGGHDIPTETIFRRYQLGIDNLFQIFIPIVDYWAIYDNNFHTRLIADSHTVLDSVNLKTIQELCQKK
ncbi:MAG: zeta toxin family protein [Paramuribaculum sp.]|nr:zeta toxin family protein [Paramuribaculum sp.]MDE7470931.1 zeta toxin family protein [Paramuribaculum sp.]